jgi:hypothetical protein
MSESVHFPIKKFSATMTVSEELAREASSVHRMFPRRRREVKHPPTAEEKAEYRAYKARWEAMESARSALISEGMKRDWATSDGGYEWEPAELLPLEPRIETIYLETVEEWETRIAKLVAHHDKTGKWLEKPRALTFFDSLYESITRQPPIVDLIGRDQS